MKIISLKLFLMLPYESLSVYQKAFLMNQNVYRFLKSPNDLPAHVRNQLGRAAFSVMLNISEGTSRNSSRDRRNFFVISRGSAFESASMIKFLAIEKDMPQEFAKMLCDGYEEISKMLYAMIRNIDTNSRNSRQ